MRGRDVLEPARSSLAPERSGAVVGRAGAVWPCTLVNQRTEDPNNNYHGQHKRQNNRHNHSSTGLATRYYPPILVFVCPALGSAWRRPADR